MADTEYNGEQLVVVSVIFLVITWISVLLRMFVRLKITKCFQADDWLMCASQMIFTVTCTFILVGVHWGIGRHDHSLPDGRRLESRKYEALALLFYILDVMLVKLSVAVFLLRIAVQERYKWILKVSMTILAIWSLGIFFFETFRCSPVEAQWNVDIPHTCASGQAFRASSYALSLMTIISDFLYALIPIPMLWSVQMTKQAKITVAVILSLGIFASIATLVRVKYLAGIANLSDILFSATNALTWSVVEPGTAITAASLVTIRPLLRAMNIAGFKGSNTAYTTSSRGPIQNQNISLRSGGQSEGGIAQSSHNSQREIDRWAPNPNMKRPTLVHTEQVGDGESEEYILEGLGVGRVSQVEIESDRSISRDHNLRQS